MAALQALPPMETDLKYSISAKRSLIIYHDSILFDSPIQQVVLYLWLLNYSLYKEIMR